MTIKLRDYIDDSKKPISEEEWHELYAKAYIENGHAEEKLAEDLAHVSAEVDKLTEM